MTDTQDDFHDVIGDIYVERDTSLIYEVKFFEDFVLVRPGSPCFYTSLRKLSHVEFAAQFDEYSGDHSAVKDAIRGMTPELVVE
jgi:hypothetical protein